MVCGCTPGSNPSFPSSCAKLHFKFTTRLSENQRLKTCVNQWNDVYKVGDEVKNLFAFEIY